MADDIVVRVSVDTAEAMAATFKYSQSLEKLQLQQNRAAAAQAKLDAALVSGGASSNAAVAAQAKLDAALRKTVVAENQVAIAAQRSAEVQAAASAKAAAAAEAAAAKQAAAMKRLGSITGGVGLAIAASLGLAAKAASDFNAKMATFKSLSGASAKQMQALTSAAHGFADLGIDASEAADGMIELTKAGLSVEQILGGSLKASLVLAADGQMAVADATEIMASAMVQFKLPAADAAHVADLLAAGADKALGSVQDLGEGLQYAGLGAHQAGLSIDETVGALAEFAQAGLIGSQGGTTLQQVLRQLLGPTDKAAAEIKTLGLNLYDANGHFVGLSSVAGQLQDKLGAMGEAERNAALNTLFTSRAVRGATILYQDGARGVDSWVEKVNDSGFAAEQASGKMDSLQGDLQKLGAVIKNDLIDVGQQLQPILRDITQSLTTFGDIIGGLPDPVKATAVEVGAVVAALGLGFWAFTRIKGAAVGLAETLGILATAQTRVATTAGAMAASEGAATAAMARQSAAATGLAGRLNMGGLGKAGAGLGLLLGGSVAGQQGGAAGSIGSMTLNAAGATLLLGGGATLALPVGAFAALFAAMKNARDTAGPGFPGRSTTGDFSGGVGPGQMPSGGGAFSGGGPPSGWTTPPTAEQEKYRTSAAQTAKVLAQLGETGQRTYSELASGAAGIQHAAVSLESLAKAARGAWAETLKMANVVLTRRGDWSSYQQSIDDASAALKQNGKTLDQTTEKGRANAAVLDNIAVSAATYAQTIKDPILKLNFMQESRRQLLQTAMNFGDTKAEAWKYVNSVLGIPKEARTLAEFEKNEAANDIETYAAAINNVPGFKNTVVTADTEQALRKLAYVQQVANNLHGTLWVNVQYSGSSLHGGVQQGAATGGLARHGRVQRFAGGGSARLVRGPGGPTGDMIPAMLSDFEFINDARTVRREGVGRMFALNQGRATIVPKPTQYLAQGGMAGQQAWRGGGSTTVVIDAGAIRRALDGMTVTVANGAEIGGQVRLTAKQAVNQTQALHQREALAGRSQ